VVVVGGIVRYTHPQFFRRLWKRRQTPAFYFATKYPNNVVLDRDLPRFFHSYSIATPENEFAQKAVQRVIRSRNRLRRGLGETKTILRAWDASNIKSLVKKGICGEDFTIAFRKGSDQRKDDLLMWCLLATRVVEGFFLESVEMIDSALFLTRKRGMVVKKQPQEEAQDGYGALSTAYYLQPRMNKTALEWIPSKALAMIISTPEEAADGPSGAREMLERYLYELVVTEGNEDDFLVLEEVCHADHQPERAIAINCPHGNDGECCYFVLPERYGGRFHQEDVE